MEDLIDAQDEYFEFMDDFVDKKKHEDLKEIEKRKIKE
jgi:hypothetical protein